MRNAVGDAGGVAGRLGAEQWTELVEWQQQHRWHPHQLRHSAATRIRRDYGPDAARAALGQKCLDATEIYAEIDAETIEKVVRQSVEQHD
jgi:site-specific recombinase XerD